MAHHKEAIDIEQENLDLGGGGKTLMLVTALGGLVAGLCALGLGLNEGDHLRRFAYSYLLNFHFFLTLSLGALVFVMIQYVTKAGWSVVVRRVPEMIASNIPIMAVLVLPLIFLAFQKDAEGNYLLYEWMNFGDPGYETHFAVGIKEAFLQPSFWVIRIIAYFAVLGVLGWIFLRRSSNQDKTGDPGTTLFLERLSAPGIILYALASTFFAVDTLMSLNYMWYSTIWGVYYFAGSFIGGIAVISLFCMILQATGRLKNAITAEHYQDLGKLLFGFIVFWAYIAFSQYMLIWYGNIPEETMFYELRQEGAWANVSWFLLIGHFVIPFVGLISRWFKRAKPLFAFWCVWMLVAHWIDLYWIVMPQYVEMIGLEGELTFRLYDILLLLGIGGIWMAGALFMAGSKPLVPVKDPRLKESLVFENV